jgi:CDP-diacylglycerol--serine O-phosphatidyltransferase
MKQYIPNLLTLSNLFFGCCAIVCILNNAPLDAFWFIAASFVADGLDGQVARVLNVSSPLGKELDSIADTVSFAVVPGMILYVLLCKSFAMTPSWAKYGHAVQGVILPALPAFLVSVAGGFRLAKYNIDTRQSNKFIGVPTPANTVFVAGLLLIYANNPILGGTSLGEMLLNPYLLFTLIPILSYWQIAELPLMNFRPQGFSWQENKFRYIYIAAAVVGVLLFGSLGISLSVVSYVLISIVENSLNRS